MAFSFLKGIIARAAGSATAVQAAAVTGIGVDSATTGTNGIAGQFISSGTNGIGLYTSGPSASGYGLYSNQGNNYFTGLVTANAGIQLPVGNSPAGTSSGYLQAATDHGLVFNDAGTLRIGRTIEHGTSFPGSPYDTQLYFRDDLFTLYEYDSSTFSGPSGAWYKVGVGGKDNTTRSDSATNPGRLQTGQAWQPLGSATGGIRSNQLYLPSDANADTMTFKSYGCDQPVIQVQMAGTNGSNVNYRSPAILFHYIDASNYFAVDNFNGNVRVYKNDAGSFTVYATVASSLSDGTFATYTVVQSGTLVTVYKNGVAVISSQDIFATANYKYLAIDTCGLLIAKGGSPATAANFKNYVVRQAA